ncbi:chorion peroxidase-like isoform X2 [Ochlerotatus camptorhynchus]|uniref:chorion peroxidase-like isoform X2 n=1 Tax=Ochlerotatus camptorhynchus TaxID=644619 RepID=UPI0031DDC3DD
MLAKVLLVSLFPVVLCVGSGPQLSTGEASSANLTHAVIRQHDPNGCEQNEACTVAVECASDAEAKANMMPCSSASGVVGVCCPTSPNHRHKRSLKPGGEYFFLSAIHDGRRQYDEQLRHMHKHRATMTAKQKPESMFHRLLQPTGLGHGHFKDLTQQADIYGHVYASRKYADMTHMSLEERQGDLFIRGPRNVEPMVVWCDPYARYRTIDGSCNNPLPDRAGWGSAGYPFERLLPPAYEDGVWAPRIHSVTGNLLASTRTISAVLFPDVDHPDPHLNILFMQLGQFVTHDITLSQSIPLDNGEDVECCTPDGSRALYGEELHFACMPIEISPYDPFYSRFGVSCMNFVRIKLACGSECTLGYGTQGNSVTHFIDASPVYGSSDFVAASVRSFHQGQLRASYPTGIELPPFASNPRDCVPWARVCFETGDIRVNQLLALTQVQTLFLREHNRLAKGLSHVNPHWDDEKLYQEARKIVIGEYQNLVFNEYLPLLLGRKKAQQLMDPPHGHTYFYNANLPPMTLTESAVAAFRFGHSTIDGFFRLLYRDAPPEIVPIADVFTDPSKILEPNSFDRMMHSFGEQPQQQVDNYKTYGVTRFLLPEGKPYGSDLAAINMQRGRDFAMRPYNDYRELAGLPRVTDFRQMGEMAELLAQVYESPDDIDLWPGGLLEPPGNGAIVGPTFSYLIAEMFSRLKFGDRYYFTNGPEVNPGAFTLQQLSEIRRTSLASLICANVDNWYDFYQTPKAFLRSSWDNEPIPCASHYSLDLDAWRD